MDMLIDVTRRLALIKKRYAVNHVIIDQDVAQHSFNAAVIAYILLEERLASGSADLDWHYGVLAATLLHDAHEGITGDLNYNTKSTC
jgi:5'-deoxynucleotidase YfbR-like HD superfamily hydrolase